MKKLFFPLLTISYLVGCTPLQKSASVTGSSIAADRGPHFLENIAISPSAYKGSLAPSISHPDSAKLRSGGSLAAYPNDIENSRDLQFKYSILLNLPVEAVSNARLLQFMDEWYGAPYRYGGNSKDGVDCSAFVSSLVSAGYGFSIPRSSRDQYAACKKIKKKDLHEGDLVFFNTKGGISHVGVFLANNKFIHASSSGGVMISDLEDKYYTKRYIAAGTMRL